MVFEVYADYRSFDKNVCPRYYVVAQNKKEARQKASKILIGLKIYIVEELLDLDIKREILNNPAARYTLPIIY